MFLLKKTIGTAFMPLSICIELMLIGAVVRWGTKKRKLGSLLIASGVVLLVGFSFGPLPNLLLLPLESSYPPLTDMSAHDGVETIVILGGGHVPDLRLTPNSRLSYASLSRLAEGIRLHRLLPGSRIVVSGGSLSGNVPIAETMAKAAASLGVHESDILLNTRSRDTKDEAIHVKQIVKESEFILVTSAAHMPRAVALFQKLGMEPIPAPTDFLVKEAQNRIWPTEFFPDTHNLVKAESALHEYLGLTWAWLRGQI